MEHPLWMLRFEEAGGYGGDLVSACGPKIEGIVLGIAAEGERRSNQVSNRIDLSGHRRWPLKFLHLKANVMTQCRLLLGLPF